MVSGKSTSPTNSNLPGSIFVTTALVFVINTANFSFFEKNMRLISIEGYFSYLGTLSLLVVLFAGDVPGMHCVT